MRITVTARHMDISEVVKDYATDKVDRLPRLYDRLTGADVVLDAAESGHSAEIILHQNKGAQIIAEGRHEDMHAAIDEAITKIETQLRKKKTMLKDKRRKE